MKKKKKDTRKLSFPPETFSRLLSIGQNKSRPEMEWGMTPESLDGEKGGEE